MERIDISSWTVLSKRIFSTNYISPDRRWLLKYYTRFTEENLNVLKEEQQISEKVIALGIPTPAVGGIAELTSGEKAALYEFIDEKKSLSRAVSEDLSLMPEMMQKMVGMGNLIHNTACDKTAFRPIEEKIIANVKRSGIFTEDEQTRIFNFIDSVPKADTCLHGDFHPGNFITSPKGDYTIDLGNFCYGNPLYDWAHWYFMSHVVPDEHLPRIFHMDRENVTRCWKLTLKYAFGCETEEQIADFENTLEPFQAFGCILFLDVMPAVPPTLQMIKQTNSLFR